MSSVCNIWVFLWGFQKCQNITYRLQCIIPANTKHLYNIYTMLAQRLVTHPPTTHSNFTFIHPTYLFNVAINGIIKQMRFFYCQFHIMQLIKSNNVINVPRSSGIIQYHYTPYKMSIQTIRLIGDVVEISNMSIWMIVKYITELYGSWCNMYI